MMSLTFGLFTQVSGSGPLGPLVLQNLAILTIYCIRACNEIGEMKVTLPNFYDFYKHPWKGLLFVRKQKMLNLLLLTSLLWLSFLTQVVKEK